MFYVGTNGPIIEKDPEIEKLCRDSWSGMRDVVMPEITFEIEPDAIAFVSFEDALKELAAMKNSGTVNF
jgi:hypothetical protein